jgi:hypothetical protein
VTSVEWLQAAYRPNGRAADGQVHVESLVSLAEHEPDDSNGLPNL